jgi:hypothetical protein
MSVRCSWRRSLCAAALLTGACAVEAYAEDNPTAGWREIETKYVFGFTEGSGIGLEGEKEIEIVTDARFGKRAGRYAASQTKLEYETTPNQFIQVEFGALVASHQIRNVTDLDDRKQVELSGAFGELRYLLLGRGPGSPFGVTLSVEPAWRRIDETSGERVSNYELETKLAVDTELVENRVYAGFNLLYEPEMTRSGGAWERESTFGVSGGLAFRLAEGVLIGAELGYFRHYDGLAFNAFTGDALYVGPTLYVQLARKMFMTAAWSAQVFGRELEHPELPLNLAEFSRHKAKLRLAMEF